MTYYNISFIGAGRVGAALCAELFNSGHKIDLVVNQDETTGRRIARSFGASWSFEPSFPPSTDVVIVAVPDHALPDVLKKIDCKSGTLVAHTAGSLGLDIFPAGFSDKGVFYPLQTFSPNRKISFENLPFFLETSGERSEMILTELAESIGGKVFFADTSRRVMLHLAAVFACNFTNHMLTEARELAGKAGFPYEILIPLINETIAKASYTGPEESQTGPAVRGDLNTIEKHLLLLSDDPGLQKIYRSITDSIMNYYNTGKSGKL